MRDLTLGLRFGENVHIYTLYSPLSASQPLAPSLYLCAPSQTHWGPLGRWGSDTALTLWWLFPFQMGLVAILVATVVAMSAVAQLWEDEWEVLLISLQVSGGGDGVAASPGPSKQDSAFMVTPVSLDQGPEEVGRGPHHIATQRRGGCYNPGYKM